MKKTISILFATAFLLAGCGDNTSSESNIPEPTETAEVTEIAEITETPTEKPTDRVRDIESTDDFEYEFLDIGAVITRYTGNATDVVIPDTIEGIAVNKIGFLSFEAKFDVVSVTLPETLDVICEGAFMDCSSLTSINIPESVTTIERSAFAGCTALESVVIPESVKTIEMEAFTACESMTSLTVYNPALKYEDWGLETLPSLTIYAPAGSEIYKWASENNISVSAL